MPQKKHILIAQITTKGKRNKPDTVETRVYADMNAVIKHHSHINIHRLRRAISEYKEPYIDDVIRIDKQEIIYNN